MTKEEFRGWYRHHAHCFPGVDSWLGKHPKHERPGDDAPSQEGILSAWAKCLSDVTLADATLATDLLFRGEEEEPKSFDSHPRAVRRIAKRFSAKRTEDQRYRHYHDGEETYRCLDCQDSGIVTVVHSRSIAAARDGQLRHVKLNPDGRTGLYSAGVACGCERGIRRLKFLEVQYEPQRFVLWQTDDDALWQDVMAFVRPDPNKYLDPQFQAF